MNEFERALSEINGYPSGDSDAWISRYEPLIDTVIRHRDVSAPRVTAVVVAWKAERFLIECLDHLRGQVGIDDGSLEIVLVDNGGSERVRDEIAERVDVEIRMKGNALPGRARNLGVAMARGEIIALVDDDGMVECDYVRNALRYFEDPDLIAIRGRIVAREHPLFTTLATHYSRGVEVVDDCLITEGSSFIRKSNYIAVGGLDEKMFGHEGIDLTFRLLREFPDAKVLYAPEVVMHHDYVDTWQKFWRKNWRYVDVDQRTQARDADLSRFMDDYFGRSFDRAPMTSEEKVAREALKAVRTLMRVGSTVQGRLKGK